MKTPYTPISCSFYDRLEAWAVRREHVEIQFRRNDSDTIQLVSGVIADVFSKDNAEYLIVSTGEKIRLDRLVAVNNIPLPESGSCAI